MVVSDVWKVSAWSVAPNDVAVVVVVVVVVAIVDLICMKAFEWFDIWCDVFLRKRKLF